MKCPKCGYLGFETTDRCRNCQYDFSLAPFSADPELTLHGAEHRRESASDFELPPIARQTDKLSATALDLDRLFGDAEPRQSRCRRAGARAVRRSATSRICRSIEVVDLDQPDVDIDVEQPEPEHRSRAPSPAPTMSMA